MNVWVTNDTKNISIPDFKNSKIYIFPYLHILKSYLTIPPKARTYVQCCQ